MADDAVKKALLAVLSRLYSREKMEEAGQMSIAFINLRVQRGVSLTGSIFDAYTPSYLKRKTNAGKYSGRVDLMWTGNMLRDIKTLNRRDPSNAKYEVEVGYLEGNSPMESIDRARWHNTTGAGRGRVKRQFVGLTPDERARILQWFQS